MTDWPAFLRSVSVLGALPVTFEATGPDALGVKRARVSMRVLCVLSGSAVWISRTVPLPEWRDEIDAAEWVREQVVWMYRHEANEQIEIDGVRVFEPVGEHPQ